MSQRSSRWATLALAAASTLATLAMLEVAVRVGIAAGVAALRSPDLYADSSTDDDWWKLHHRWGGKFGVPERAMVDPLLGWAPPRTRTNPLGIVRDEPYTVERRPPIYLFYGDSFVKGLTPNPDKVPQRLESRLGGPVVYNYGVGGYGVDQIYLRYRESIAQFDDPTVIVGVMTDDVDRCILRVRSGQKPYFEIEDGALVLHGTPIDPDPNAWLAAHPPSIRSYLAAMVRRAIYRIEAGDHPTEQRYKRAEKERIGTRIIEELVADVRGRGLPLLFVLFYPRYELDHVGWRETLLRDVMARQGVPYVDMKELFLAEAQRRGVPPESFFDGGHPNAAGNDIVAAALAERLRAGPPG